MKIRRPPDKKELAGQRLRVAREALNLSQADICKEFNVGRTTWNNWEAGLSLPDVLVMAKLSASRKVTLDWIYNGDLSGVPYALATKINSHKIDT